MITRAIEIVTGTRVFEFGALFFHFFSQPAQLISSSRSFELHSHHFRTAKLDQVCHATNQQGNGRNSEANTPLVFYVILKADDSFHNSLAPIVLRGSTPVRKNMRRSTAVLFFTAAAASVSAIQVDPSVLDACPGYSATNIKTRHDGLTADLALLPNPCNVFGDDIAKLSLSVVYETGMFVRSILDIQNYNLSS